MGDWSRLAGDNFMDWLVPSSSPETDDLESKVFQPFG
jgi:hypothetical protein